MFDFVLSFRDWLSGTQLTMYLRISLNLSTKITSVPNHPQLFHPFDTCFLKQYHCIALAGLELTSKFDQAGLKFTEIHFCLQMLGLKVCPTTSGQYFLLVCDFFFFWFFEPYVTMAVLELTMYTRLPSKSEIDLEMTPLLNIMYIYLLYGVLLACVPALHSKRGHQISL